MGLPLTLGLINTLGNIDDRIYPATSFISHRNICEGGFIM